MGAGPIGIPTMALTSNSNWSIPKIYS
jgi:hypothetical protein